MLRGMTATPIAEIIASTPVPPELPNIRAEIDELRRIAQDLQRQRGELVGVGALASPMAPSLLDDTGRIAAVRALREVDAEIAAVEARVQDARLRLATARSAHRANLVLKVTARRRAAAATIDGSWRALLAAWAEIDAIDSSLAAAGSSIRQHAKAGQIEVLFRKLLTDVLEATDVIPRHAA
jgi:hypothetical protein